MRTMRPFTLVPVPSIANTLPAVAGTGRHASVSRNLQLFIGPLVATQKCVYQHAHAWRTRAHTWRRGHLSRRPNINTNTRRGEVRAASQRDVRGRSICSPLRGARAQPPWHVQLRCRRCPAPVQPRVPGSQGCRHRLRTTLSAHSHRPPAASHGTCCTALTADTTTDATSRLDLARFCDEKGTDTGGRGAHCPSPSSGAAFLTLPLLVRAPQPLERASLMGGPASTLGCALVALTLQLPWRRGIPCPGVAPSLQRRSLDDDVGSGRATCPGLAPPTTWL